MAGGTADHQIVHTLSHMKWGQLGLEVLRLLVRIVREQAAENRCRRSTVHTIDHLHRVAGTRRPHPYRDADLRLLTALRSLHLARRRRRVRRPIPQRHPVLLNSHDFHSMFKHATWIVPESRLRYPLAAKQAQRSFCATLWRESSGLYSSVVSVSSVDPGEGLGSPANHGETESTRYLYTIALISPDPDGFANS